MADYQLYCFAQSGNAYRTALMLNLIGAKWEPVWYDFFGTAPQRTPEFRESIYEMGEAMEERDLAFVDALASGIDGVPGAAIDFRKLHLAA